MREPTYNLEIIKSMIINGNYHITGSALMGAFIIGQNEHDIVTAVLQLDNFNYYKTMRSRVLSDLWQDVYHLKYSDYLLYIKLQINNSNTAVIISYKEK